MAIYIVPFHYQHYYYSSGKKRHNSQKLYNFDAQLYAPNSRIKKYISCPAETATWGLGGKKTTFLLVFLLSFHFFFLFSFLVMLICPSLLFLGHRFTAEVRRSSEIQFQLVTSSGCMIVANKLRIERDSLTFFQMQFFYHPTPPTSTTAFVCLLILLLLL